MQFIRNIRTLFNTKILWIRIQNYSLNIQLQLMRVHNPKHFIIQSTSTHRRFKPNLHAWRNRKCRHQSWKERFKSPNKNQLFCMSINRKRVWHIKIKYIVNDGRTNAADTTNACINNTNKFWPTTINKIKKL